MDTLNLSGTQGRTSQRIDELISLDCFPRNQLISPWLVIYMISIARNLVINPNCSFVINNLPLRRCQVILKRKNLALVLNGNCKPLEVIWSLQWRNFDVWKLPHLTPLPPPKKKETRFGPKKNTFWGWPRFQGYVCSHEIYITILFLFFVGWGGLEPDHPSGWLVSFIQCLVVVATWWMVSSFSDAASNVDTNQTLAILVGNPLTWIILKKSSWIEKHSCIWYEFAPVV